MTGNSTADIYTHPYGDIGFQTRPLNYYENVPMFFFDFSVVFVCGSFCARVLENVARFLYKIVKSLGYTREGHSVLTKQVAG